MVRTKVFVGNLSFQTKEAELAAEFASAGKVISANIITRGPRSLGYGFVEMDSEEDANKAVQVMNKKDIGGRPINVEIAKPQDETKKRNLDEPKEGGTRRRRRRPPPRKTFEDGEEGETVEGGKIDGRRRRIRRRTPGRKRVSNEDKIESKTTLFVANLPFSLDDDGFSKIVTDLALKLKAAHVVKKRNGRSKGYGFIEFDQEEDQQKALNALNKKVVDSRELSVKIALTERKTEEGRVQDEEQHTEEKEAKPVPKIVEKKTIPVDKKPVSSSESPKVPPPTEKKVFEKKVVSPTATPSTEKPQLVSAEKKVVTTEKKSSPTEKKVVTPEKKPVVVPTEKKTATPEKKPVVVTTEKKTATPEKKEEKK